MKNSQFFPLVVSSLAVGGVTLFSNPAQSAIFNGNSFNTFNDPIVGIKFVVSGIGGSPLNVNSFTSPQFPLTQIEGNNTPLVNATFTGSVVQPGDPFGVILDVADNPNGTAGFRIVQNTLFVATATGVEETPPGGSFTVTGSASPEATTPFSAFKVTTTRVINGQTFEGTAFYQVPGDQLNFTDTTFSVPLTFQISSKPIPGYVPVDQLGDFGPSVEVVLLPGGSVNVPVTPGTPGTSVPEPSVVASLSVLSLGAFLKRKSLKSQKDC